MIGQALGDPLRAFVLVYGARRECVVADDDIAVQGHVRPGGIGLLVRQRELPQPLVEGCAGAIESAHIVLAAEFVDDELCPRSGGHDRRLATCGSRNSRRSRGLSLAGRSSAARNAFHCFSPSTNRVCSASASSALSRALRMMNSVTLTPCRSAATLISSSSEAVARS